MQIHFEIRLQAVILSPLEMLSTMQIHCATKSLGQKEIQFAMQSERHEKSC